MLSKNFIIGSCLIIFLLTFAFFNFGELNKITMSAIGNANPEQRMLFIVWGICTSFCTSLFLVRLFNTLNYHAIMPRILLFLSILSLTICTLAPSLAQYPGWGKIHNTTATLYAVFLLLSIVMFLIRLCICNSYIGKTCIYMFLCAIAVPISMFAIYGHCGMYEISFFLIIPIMLFGFTIYLGRYIDMLNLDEDWRIARKQNATISQHCNSSQEKIVKELPPVNNNIDSNNVITKQKNNHKNINKN